MNQTTSEIKEGASVQVKDSYFYIDEYGIVHSDHPGEDGLIFDRDKFMGRRRRY